MDQEEQAAGEEVVLVPVGGTVAAVSRAEVVRLLSDSLRRLGFARAAAALEADAGQACFSREVQAFVDAVRAGAFADALRGLDGLPFRHGRAGRKRARQVLVQERYLHALERAEVADALEKLRADLAQGEADADLDELAALVACPTREELARCARTLREKRARRVCPGVQLDHDNAVDFLVSLLDADAVVPPNRLFQLLGEALTSQFASHPHGMNLIASQDGGVLPLLRDVKDIEDEKVADNVPSPEPMQVIRVRRSGSSWSSQQQQQHRPRHEPTPDLAVEVWCVSFSPQGDYFAVGTNDGTVIVYRVDPTTLRASEAHRYAKVFGREEEMTIAGLDFGTTHLLVVGRRGGVAGSGSNGTHASVAVGSRRIEEEEEEEGEGEGEDEDNEDDEAEDVDNEHGGQVEGMSVDGDAMQEESARNSLICVLPVAKTQRGGSSGKKLFFPSRLAHHGSRPFARWVTDSETVVSSGPDGTLRYWAVSETGVRMSTMTKTERVVDLVVTAQALSSPPPRRGAGDDGEEEDDDDDVVDTVTMKRSERATPRATQTKELVFVACADCTIRVYLGTRNVYSLSTNGQSIVALNISDHLLAACMKNEQLFVWHLRSIKAKYSLRQSASASSSSSWHGRGDGNAGAVTTTNNGGAPPSVITLQGLSRKHFVLRPSIGVGEFVASGSEDGLVHVWSCGTLMTKEVAQLKGHTASVSEVCWNPVRAGHLVSVADDGSIRCWGPMRKRGSLSSSSVYNSEDEDIEVDEDGEEVDDNDNDEEEEEEEEGRRHPFKQS